ncbi:MAG: alpha/beta hydrolase [Planctomycetota bacterium]
MQPAADAAGERDAAYLVERDVPYRSGERGVGGVLDAYAAERCVLDVYAPRNAEGFATVVWLHGGGITEGEKFIPEGLKNNGIAVVAANYRLHPRVKAPVYIEDAAAAVAWTVKNIERFGGDPSKVFVSGHSAGGYLTSIVGMDPRWLAAHGVDANDLAGLAPISGHTITHFTIRRERGLAWTQAVIDEYAPQYHVRDDAPPIVLLLGDRELELLGRYEENAYFWRMMQVVGHPDTTIFELDGFDHGGIGTASLPLIVSFVNRISGGDG